MIRLFVALRPPPAIREALADLQEGVPGARWQDDDQLHLTLRFVGEVERPQAEDLAAALAQVHAPAPHVALAGVGSFGARGRADTLWAGLAPAAPLHHLHAKVEQACARAGLPAERRAYAPHITLARLPRSLAACPRSRPGAPATPPCRRLSSRSPTSSSTAATSAARGPTYEPVARWALERGWGGTAGPSEAS